MLENPSASGNLAAPLPRPLCHSKFRDRVGGLFPWAGWVCPCFTLSTLLWPGVAEDQPSCRTALPKIVWFRKRGTRQVGKVNFSNRFLPYTSTPALGEPLSSRGDVVPERHWGSLQGGLDPAGPSGDTATDNSGEVQGSGTPQIGLPGNLPRVYVTQPHPWAGRHVTTSPRAWNTGDHRACPLVLRIGIHRHRAGLPAPLPSNAKKSGHP
jgi:hypothetical protein